ncbi:MAG: SCP2 sterol-binding domain-containing protein [Bacteroidota bacterium]
MEIDQIRTDMTQKVKTIDPIGKKLKFLLDGDAMLIDGSGDANIVSAEDTEADCTIRMTKDTYIKLQQKKIKPMIATLTGKIKVKGDIATAQKLKKLM